MVSPNEGENIFQVGCFLMLVVCKLVDYDDLIFVREDYNSKHRRVN